MDTLHLSLTVSQVEGPTALFFSGRFELTPFSDDGYNKLLNSDIIC